MMLEKPLSHIDLGGGIRGWLDAYDIIRAYTIKPVIWGGIAAVFCA
jgi:hypothetical protein